jgi:hypothetical protein
MGYSETGSLFYFKKLLVFFLVTIKNCCSFVAHKEEITFHNNQTNAMTNTRSKVMILAWAITKTGISFGAAQGKAWEVIRLKESMKKGVVSFTYQKKDGTIRQATGTTSGEHFTYQRKTNRKGNPATITYYDLEKQSFRAFKAANLLQVA